MPKLLTVPTYEEIKMGLNDRQVRNRRKLLQALNSGVKVLGHVGISYYVSSQSRPGQFHTVERFTDGYGFLHERCDCEWGQKQGWIFKGSLLVPCVHVLVVRWHELSDERRGQMLESDPDLAALFKTTPALVAVASR